MLESFQPERICIELPGEFGDWIQWLAHNETVAPVSLAASGRSGELFFYPLADFSPELAAIRWAAKHDVQIQLIDLPLRHRNQHQQHSLDSSGTAAETDSDESAQPAQSAQTEAIETRYQYVPWLVGIERHFGVRDTEALWERLVESPGINATDQAARRAALLFGLIVRDNSQTILDRDRMREAWMRSQLFDKQYQDRRTVAVIGSFHAVALAQESSEFSDKEYDRRVMELIDRNETDQPMEPDWTTALIPYSFGQLDSRSGYPAGVLDPVWHQSIWECTDNEQRYVVLKQVLVEICRDLRKRGVNASTADAISALSMTEDLSRIRNLGTPGRSELHEAITSTLVQGEQIGRRKSVAAAARRVLIGHRMGQLPSDSPRSGLVPHVEHLLSDLRLPGPDTATQKPKRMRLDALRNTLDRARSVTLQRMKALDIPYGTRLDQSPGSIGQASPFGGRENLTEHWEVNWHHATTARLYTLTTQGINLQQAVTATIRRWSRNDDPAGEFAPDIVLSQLSAAAICGVGPEVNRAAAQINESFADSANLPQIVAAANWYQRICKGLVPGLPVELDLANPPIVPVFDPARLRDRSHLLATAIARLEGVTGSDSTVDARSVMELTSWIESADENWPVDGGLRFRSWLKSTADQGSPLMQGVSLGCQMQLQMAEAQPVQSTTIGWWDQAATVEGRQELTGRLTGWLLAAGSRIVGDPIWLEGIDQAIVKSTDDDFLHRLLSLHSGFRTLDRKLREQLLQAKLSELPGESASSLPIPNDPIIVAANRQMDRLARTAIARVLPELEIRKLDPNSLSLSEEQQKISETLKNENELTTADRWRLMLGGKPESGQGRRVRGVFGDLLGGDGDSEAGDLVEPPERSGGQGAPAIDSRDWAKQLEKLLGSKVAEEVLIDAAAKGRLAVFQVINPKRTPPNPDLLRQILSMHSHAEGEMLERLRAIARSISDRLAKLLAIRLRTHLTGLLTSRPRSRPSPMLDLSRTLRRNLKHTYRDSNGNRKVVAANPVFKTPATRNMDWSIHLVVDVSGSMETSTVYAALVASVFANLPAVDLQFLAFSTEVADLSQHVDDPLSLLTEVRIGGGTHIALGLRAARQAIRVPQRSIVVLITDFHEGVSVPELLGEIRTLSASGSKLLGLAALDDQAATVYHTGIASQCVAAGMPIAALSPEELADWVAKQIRGAN